MTSSANGASKTGAEPAASTHRTTWPSLIGALVNGESLTAGETAWAMNEIMSGEATAVQIAGFGVALRAKGETVEEMAGLAQTMLDHALPLDIPGRVVDLVGTGGDGARTVNISTMGAIVAAASGAKMAKHGNRAASSACGAADVLEALGIVIDLPPQKTQQVVAETGIAFLFAPLYHPALRHAAAPRAELGVPTVFNFLGPVANPARPQALAVGVANERMCEVIAGVLALRGCSALVFHGSDGLDELTTTATSNVWVVKPGTPGEVSRGVVDPADLGIARAELDDLRGGDAAANAAVARAVLGGERGPVRDTVLLNAAAALAADAGVDGAAALTEALREGYARAAQAIDSGAAAALLSRWAETTQRLAKAV
jgi:anthranilate phosphoribosyltransferase